MEVKKNLQSTKDDEYEDIEKLKQLIRKGKYRLECGDRVTLNHNLGNNIAIINGKELQIICTLCLYARGSRWFAAGAAPGTWPVDSPDQRLPE